MSASKVWEVGSTTGDGLDVSAAVFTLGSNTAHPVVRKLVMIEDMAENVTSFTKAEARVLALAILEAADEIEEDS